MARKLLSLLTAAIVVSAGTWMLAQSQTASPGQVLRSALHDYRVVTVSDALVQAWAIAFLPGGDILVTERPGRLRIIRQGKLVDQPVEGIPKVHHVGQGGLLEVMPHPNFASNRLLYLTYSKPGATR